MKAIGLRQAGSDPELMELPRPDIDVNEVLVRVRTIGVGLHDRWFLPKEPVFPYVIGIEATGTVEAVGAEVADHRVGDRVMFSSSMRPRGGVWAEFSAVAAEALVTVPDDLDFVRAAALPVAGSTALEAVRALQLEAGDAVFMAGASGAIGTLAIQLAKSAGARVAASASTANHDYMRELGAELTVDYHDPHWVERVRVWAPGGVAAAMAIQPDTGADCLRATRDGGRVVTVSGDQVPAERGIEVTQVLVRPETKSALATLAGRIAGGDIHVEIERTYPLEDGMQALEKTETRHARGKLVLTVV